jgi:hypothetical protein
LQIPVHFHISFKMAQRRNFEFPSHFSTPSLRTAQSFAQNQFFQIPHQLWWRPTGHFERSSHAAGCAQLVKSARCSRVAAFAHSSSSSKPFGCKRGGGGGNGGGGSITHKSKRERQAGVCGLAGGRGWGVAFRKRDRSKIPNAATAAAATAPAGAACHGARGPRGYRPGACGGVQKN